MLKSRFFLLTFLFCSTVFAKPSREALLTVSGGVSLGAYEAGFLYYLTEFEKKTSLIQFPIATGASAGAINSILTAVARCEPENNNYEESIFWKTWIPLGIQQLAKENSPLPYAVFGRSAMNEKIKEIRDYFENHTSEACQTYVGIQVTRRQPKNIQLSTNLTVPKLSELLTFKIKGEKVSKSEKLSLSVANFPIAKKGSKPIQLPFNGEFNHDFDLLTRAVLASAAFPIAFEPVQLPYCDSSTPKCNDQTAISGEFIDGGIYDNQPLRAALTISKELSREKPPIILLDPSTLIAPKESVEDKSQSSILSVILGYGNSFVENGRKMTSSKMDEEEPGVSERIIHTTAEFPLNSSEMGAFLGFFESSFRKSDFIFGMYEAQRLLRNKFPANQNLPEQNSSLAWRRFNCVSQVMDGATSLSPDFEFMRSDSERNYLVLLQVALDRLYASCENTDKRVTPLKHCEYAQAGQKPPQFFPEISQDSTKSGNSLKDFFALTGKYQLEFKDLGLDRSQSQDALKKVNQEMFHISYGLADKQQRPERDFVKIGARPLLNYATDYSPPRTILYLDVGPSQELGLSHTISKGNQLPSAFRYQFALRTQGITTVLNSNFLISFTPIAGLEYELMGLSNAFLQYRLGLQTGYQFGNGDSWGSQPCNGTLGDPEGWSCSGWMVNPLFIISAFDSVRLQLGPAFYPLSKGKLSWQITFQLGIQFIPD